MKPNSPISAETPPSKWIGVLRGLSIFAAAFVVALVVIYPRGIATDGISVPHGWFVLMMIGMSICWISGFGFIPHNRWLRYTFSLPVGWILLIIGAWKVFA